VTDPDKAAPLLDPSYTVELVEMPDDDEGAVVATVISRAADEPAGRAVLHVHGFADYFFQTEYAEWWTARGYAFYAIDLRKYGRSLLDHQSPGYVDQLDDHFPELDRAWQRITERDGFRSVTLAGHSTGGLILLLWLQSRQPLEVGGVVLNSPWFDMQGSFWTRTVATTVVKGVGARQPKREISRNVSGLYAQSLHVDYDGEWDFNLAWKPLKSFPVYAGWLRAVRTGHTRFHRGIGLNQPVLVLSSHRSSQPSEMTDEVHRTDIVLDVEQIRRWVPAVGRHVTSIAIDDARHDIFLSLPEVRADAYDVLDRWLTAYVDPA
jgi:alpha-beta hydrolase superfamily lysophospholipase